MSDAGQSAQDRYETLSARHRAGRGRRLMTNVVIATIVAVATAIWMGDQYGSLPVWVAGSVFIESLG